MKKLSTVSAVHVFRLVYRSALFLLLLIGYLSFRLRSGEPIEVRLEQRPVLLTVAWLVYAVEMVMRFFPSSFESPGCQKQFARNYVPADDPERASQGRDSAMLIALIWVVFNGIFGALHMTGVLDDGIMILLCSAYGVCDMICILFFCPFQSWIMKNKCCSSCRIYNWDYAMMFTPLFFVRRFYGWSLLLLSVALLVRWELAYYLYPERFFEQTNAYLRCQNCTEKLCAHKKQLRTLWRRIEADASKYIQTQAGKIPPALRRLPWGVGLTNKEKTGGRPNE